MSLMAGLNKFATLPLEATISVSGFNVYEESSEPITERSPTAENFLAKVCEDWEDEVQKFQGTKRTVILRTPMVLAHDCEFVKKAFLLADFGLATYFGNGEQSTPWIHVEDLCEIIHTSLSDARYDGIINAVAPDSVKAVDLAKKISKLKYGKGLSFPTPNFAIKAILGEAAMLPLANHNASNDKLKHLNFSYKFGAIDDCLRDVFNVFHDTIKNRTVMSYRFTQIQHINKPVDEAYEFFCDPHNLEEITPQL